MQICLANLHFLFTFELRSKLLTFSDLKVQSVALQSKKLKFIWFFAHLFVTLQPNNQKSNKKMDDYPANHYNS